MADARRGAGDGPWYRAGLGFRCEGAACGACCTGGDGPGNVWVSPGEMARLARYLGLDFDTFTRRYVRRVEGRFSLVERPNHDCVFWRDGDGCTVYEARPDQCRAYPFWSRILASRRRWEAEARRCPGIGAGGPGAHHDEAGIRRLRRLSPDRPPQNPAQS